MASGDDDDGGGGPDLEAEALKGLTAMSLEQVVRAGHEAMLRRLVAKVTAGTASHQELAILRNMLRDNGMVWSLPPPPIDGEDAKRVDRMKDLPRLESPDYDRD
jgi:hypothetical protein